MDPMCRGEIQNIIMPRARVFLLMAPGRTGRQIDRSHESDKRVNR